MSDATTPEVTEPATEDTTQQDQPDPADQLPADHPLVKTLAALKAQNKELKGKAKRADEYEEAQKSEAEKVADRIARAEAAEAAVPSKVAQGLRDHLVSIHQIAAEDAELFLTADEPELLVKQVTRLLEQSGKPRPPKPDPNQGRTSAEASTPADQFASIIRQQLNL